MKQSRAGCHKHGNHNGHASTTPSITRANIYNGDSGRAMTWPAQRPSHRRQDTAVADGPAACPLLL
eukprot:15437234-Alexandrium_andersonii.AAC.1